MVPKNIFLLILILLPLAISMPSELRRLRRSVGSYQVEGCFSYFNGSGFTKQRGNHNSNIRCQDTCRDKGYILAATKGGECHCGNIYPKGSKVDNSQCSSKCRPYTPCHEPQSCCGGPNAYSVSVVGNIDVAKQVLRRLSYEWQTNDDYRNHLKTLVTILSPQTEQANWEESFDREGWSLCGNGKYMTGLYRNKFKSGDERIGRIEFAECRDAPTNLYPMKEYFDCYNHNWWSSFNSIGWSKCNTGYYMAGIYNTNGAELYHIEEAKCCRPKSQEKLWGKCYNLDVWTSFDREGWSKCRSGYYMAGLYRNNCERLGCIEHFFCCKMGAYKRGSWIESPDLFIKVKDAAGQLKHCSMNAMDKSPSSETYKCKSASDLTNMLTLNALKFIIEDKTPLNTAKPESVAGFRPVICSSHTNSYKCSKWLTTSISTSSSFSIGTGFTLAVKVGASVELEAKFFGSGTKTAFSTEISASTSFDVESSRSNTYTTTDRTDVSVQVPVNTEVTINLLRTVQNLVYKWKADFQMLGKYSLKWKNEQEFFQDVTTVLTGPKRKIYAFGSWNYPDPDVLRVVITDKYGNEMRSGCEHNAGETVTECEP